MKDYSDFLYKKIQKHGYHNCMQFVERFVYSSNYEKRIAAAQILCFSTNEHSEKMLLHLLRDHNAMVRLEAADSIGSFHSGKIYNALSGMTSEQDPLIRGYVLFALARNAPAAAQNTAAATIENIIRREDAPFVRILGLQGLYYLGKKEALYDLISMYDSCSYSDRCAIINGFSDFHWDGIEVDRELVNRFYQIIKHETLGSIQSCVTEFARHYSIQPIEKTI